MDFFPFHALGFHCNPFRALTQREWAELAVLPDDLAQVFDRGFTHLQILGEKGAGKTTRLLALQALLEAQGRRTAYEYLPEGQSRFLTQPAGLEAFFLDEVQRLSTRQRERLARLAGAQTGIERFIPYRYSPPTAVLRLILGSHEDFGPLFTRWGLPLQTLMIQNSAGHLAQLIRSRLAYFSLAGEPPMSLDDAVVEELYARFGGDYRAILDYLYDLLQDAALHRCIPPEWNSGVRRT